MFLLQKIKHHLEEKALSQNNILLTVSKQEVQLIVSPCQISGVWGGLMQILLTGKYVSVACLKYILRVFYRINVSCLTKLKHTSKRTELSLVLVLTKNNNNNNKESSLKLM